MKKILLIAMFCSVGVFSRADAIEIAQLPHSVGGGFGLDFHAAGSAYSNRDARFQFFGEYSYRYMAFPLSLSFGQELTIVGIKPRARLPIALHAVPGLSVSPHTGFVMNYWTGSDSDGVFSASLTIIELGFQLGAEVRYDMESFYVSVIPLSLDMNFWQHASVETNFAGNFSGSSSGLGVIANMLVSAGFTF